MGTGVTRTDTGTIHDIPALQDLKAGFEGFKRAKKYDDMHVQPYVWLVNHGSLKIILLASNYLNRAAEDQWGQRIKKQTDGYRLWDHHNAVRSANTQRQSSISTQSSVLIEANPELREALPPGALDLLDKVQAIEK